MTSTTGNSEPLLCNLWPYWYSSASFGAGAKCKQTSTSFRPASRWYRFRLCGSARTRTAPGSHRPGLFHDSWFSVEARYLLP